VNLLAAVIGTAIIEAPLTGFVRPSRVAAVKADLLTITVAFGLGYFVYRRWSPSPSKWVWLAGLFWFGQRTLLTLDGQHGRVFCSHSREAYRARNPEKAGGGGSSPSLATTIFQTLS
jgi:hypothetical protein